MGFLDACEGRKKSDGLVPKIRVCAGGASC
jgi:hypothetical protein